VDADVSGRGDHRSQSNAAVPAWKLVEVSMATYLGDERSMPGP